jgi:hypothetical protein
MEETLVRASTSRRTAGSAARDGTRAIRFATAPAPVSHTAMIDEAVRSYA